MVDLQLHPKKLFVNFPSQVIHIFRLVSWILLIDQSYQLLLDVFMKVIIREFFRIQMDRAQWSYHYRKYDASHTDIQQTILQGRLDIKIDQSAQDSKGKKPNSDTDLKEEKGPTKKWKSFKLDFLHHLGIDEAIS